jgi:acyl-CoA dehydrogenase
MSRAQAGRQAKTPHLVEASARPSFLDAARRAAKIAGEHALDVDAHSRFPKEAFATLRQEALLGIMIPKSLGGEGASLRETSEICSLLAQACASTGMVYAMHQIKTSSLVTHGQDTEFHRAFQRRIASEQLLLGSATTEGGGVGGDLRSSVCGVVAQGNSFSLAKEGCLISYGDHADAILITARRAPDAPASDQVMAVLTKEQYRLQKTQVWNTMGMRGTCSDNFTFAGEAPLDHIMSAPFAEIAAQSMLAYAHILWGATWYGIAADATARAEAFVRAEARKRPGFTPPGALRLAELLTELNKMRSLVLSGIERYETARDDADALSAMDFVVAMNALKISSAQMVESIVSDAFLICGIHGYRNDSPFSLARHLRDALSAKIMINNDRILGNTSNLLAIYRHDASLMG